MEVSGPARNDAPVTIAGLLGNSPQGREIGAALFNGKVDSPRIASRELTRTEMEQAAIAHAVEPIAVTYQSQGRLLPMPRTGRE